MPDSFGFGAEEHIFILEGRRENIREHESRLKPEVVADLKAEF
jgi:hypothetical protein